MTHALAIDTTSAYLSLALVRDDEPVGSHYALCGPDMNRTILEQIDVLLRGAELSARDLDVLFVAVGPGSFIGTRIGMAVALSFAQVTGRPVLGVDALHVLAAQVEPTAVTGRFHALLNCVRDEVYHAPFAWRDGVPQALEPIAMRRLEDLTPIVGEEPVVLRRFEPRHERLDEAFSRFRRLPLRYPFPDGLCLLRVGLPRYEANPAGPFEKVEPIYLKSEAFRKWKR